MKLDDLGTPMTQESSISIPQGRPRHGIDPCEKLDRRKPHVTTTHVFWAGQTLVSYFQPNSTTLW